MDCAEEKKQYKSMHTIQSSKLVKQIYLGFEMPFLLSVDKKRYLFRFRLIVLWDNAIKRTNYNKIGCIRAVFVA